MKYIQSYALFEQAVKPSAEQDPNLEDIRFFRGSALQFKEYWDKRAGSDATRDVEYQYPAAHKANDKSLPYQDFANGESALVKSNMKTRRKYKDGDK
jgi:hypothetical protein